MTSATSDSATVGSNVFRAKMVFSGALSIDLAQPVSNTPAAHIDVDSNNN